MFAAPCIAPLAFGTEVMAAGLPVVDAQRARSLASIHVGTELSRRGVISKASLVALRRSPGLYRARMTPWSPQPGCTISNTHKTWWVTGFHPLDGARFLVAAGAPPRVADLPTCIPGLTRAAAWRRGARMAPAQPAAVFTQRLSIRMTRPGQHPRRGTGEPTLTMAQ